jgi:hypothetical protein
MEIETPLPEAIIQPVVRNTKLFMLMPTYTTAKKDETQTDSQVLKS